MRTLVLAATLVLSGCGVQACRETAASVVSGVAGCTTSQSDVGPGPLVVAPNFEIQVFEATAAMDSAPKYATKSNDVGFFELSLPAGDYRICTSGRCADLAVIAEQVVRMDYNSTTRAGWSSGL